MRLAMASLGLLVCAACETVTPQSGGTLLSTQQLANSDVVSVVGSEYSFKEWSDAGYYLRYYATNKTPGYLCIQIQERQRIELISFFGGIKILPPNAQRVQVAYHVTRRNGPNYPPTRTLVWDAHHLAPGTQPTWQDCDSSRPAQ